MEQNEISQFRKGSQGRRRRKMKKWMKDLLKIVQNVD